MHLGPLYPFIKFHKSRTAIVLLISEKLDPIFSTIHIHVTRGMSLQPSPAQMSRIGVHLPFLRNLKKGNVNI